MPSTWMPGKWRAIAIDDQPVPQAVGPQHKTVSDGVACEGTLSVAPDGGTVVPPCTSHKVFETSWDEEEGKRGE